MSEAGVAAIEQEIDEELRAALALAMPVKRPDADQHQMSVFADAAVCDGAVPQARSTGETPVPRGSADETTLPPYRAAKVKNGDAVTRALDYLLEHDPRAFLFGLDVGTYGSAFKTCKGLIERHGADRVLDMPICESASVGFALGPRRWAGGRSSSSSLPIFPPKSPLNWG